MDRAVSIMLAVLLIGSMLSVGTAAGQSFTGEVDISGDPATDGSQFDYTIGSGETIDDLNLTISGAESTKNQSQTLYAGSNTVDTNGNADPKNAEVSMSASTSATIYITLNDVTNLDTDGDGDDNWGSFGLDKAEFYNNSQLIGSNSTSTNAYRDGQIGDTQSDTVSPPPRTDEIKIYVYHEEIGYDGSVEANFDYTLEYESTQVTQTTKSGDFTTSHSEPISVSRPLVDSTVSINGTSYDLSGSQDTVAVDLDKGPNAVDVTTDKDASFSIDYAEVVETTDPSINISSDAGKQNISYSGRLSTGSTKDLSNQIDKSLVDGNVTITARSQSSHPTLDGSVGFQWSHLTTGDATTQTVESATWEEEYNVSRTYKYDRSAATTEIPLADNVISIETVELQTNGGAWTKPDFNQVGDTLVVDIGDVSAGDNTRVRSVHRKISVDQGSIDITDRTAEGASLDTDFEVTATGSDGVTIDVTGTYPDHRIHHLTSAGWPSDEFVVIGTGSSQTLKMPQAAAGSTATVGTIPLSMSSSGESVAVKIDDPETPAWSVTDQASTPDSIDIDYLDPDPETKYQIYSLSEDRSLRTAEEDDGVVSFSADGRTGSYDIRESVSTSGAAVAVAGGDDGSSSPLSIVALLVGLGGSLVGTLILGRRLGIGGTRTRLGIGLILGIVGVELATARSVLGDLLLSLQISADAFASSVIGGFLDSGAGIVVIGILILISLVIIRRRVGLPDWLLVSGGLLTGILVIDEISGGLLTGSLDELGPLVWILLLLGGGVLLYRVLAPRPINIGGGGSS